MTTDLQGLVPVIMCGGKGSRLWPLSRNLYPKQFMSFGAETTLFQDAVRRIDGLGGQAPIVVCNQEHRFMAAEQLQTEGITARIALEPEGRNTAPAVAIAALLANDEDVLLIMSADHDISDMDSFSAAVTKGYAEAQAGNLVCLGVTPSAPETGYGYIQRAAKKEDGVCEVQRFVEKPDLETAQSYLDSGEYLWNAGIFMFRADRYLEELKKYEPEMFDCCEKAVKDSAIDLDFIRLDEASFKACPSDSIDYAVMEKTDTLSVVELESPWSDLGSWGAFHSAAQQDEHGNTAKGDVIMQETEGCYIHSNNRLVATLGLKDAVVIETVDAVLVADNSQLQNIKGIVGSLKAQGRPEIEAHPKVYRPWGSFQSIANGGRFQVKILTVKPGEILSLQKHYHRSEHWVVVNGTALIVNGEEEIMLSEDESVYIPVGNVHRLTNPGKIPLEIIEVQTGSYLGEDDIVRLEDKYARLAK